MLSWHCPDHHLKALKHVDNNSGMSGKNDATDHDNDYCDDDQVKTIKT